MAIENLSIAHTDLEVRGGLQYVAIGLLSQASAMGFDNSNVHTMSYTAAAALELFDLKQGTGSLTTSGSKEGGTILFEHTVSFYIPNCSSAHLRSLETLKDQDLVVIAQQYNGTAFALGVSQAFGLEDSTLGNVQMRARLSAIEGGTGAALGDENGLTVTIVAQSGELPRVCSNTITLDTNAGTATLS